MLSIKLHTTKGKTYLLSGTQSQSPVLAPEGALAGLVGVIARSDMSVPGRSGVVPGRRRFSAIQQEVEFFLHADDGESMERVYQEFRLGWSMDTPCQFEVDPGNAVGPFFLDAILDRPLPGVSVDARARTSVTLSVDVFAPVGLWRSAPLSGTGNVTLTNNGDEVIYPTIAYSGAGGQVTAPSGARFTLPRVKKRVVVDLDPQSLRLDGAFPEGIEPGATGVWKLPAGAVLQWSELVADPWA